MRPLLQQGRPRVPAPERDPRAALNTRTTLREAACRFAVFCLTALAVAGPASGQTFELVGTRALGMGGAFVAVADDATAPYWNPAGLSNAAVVDATLQRTATNAPLGQVSVPAIEGGWRATTTYVCFAVPSLGISYLRTRIQQAVNPTAAPNDGRQHDGPGVAAVSSLATDQVGVTLLQSLLENLVVGTTLKVSRGSFVASVGPSAPLSAVFDEVAQLPADAVTRLDLDVGILAFRGPLRIGVVGRNLTEPNFAPTAATEESLLHRQVRIGIAVTPGFVVNRTSASQPSLTIAVDADLTRTALPRGDEQHVAAGLERWLKGRRLAIRGGVRANTIGRLRPMATAGASVSVRSRFLLEGQFARGDANAGQQWSLAGRLTF